jgi:hypothetical protein
MGIIMYDSVDLSQVPANPPAVAVYVDGRFANAAEAKRRFPQARLLTIAVFAKDDADCLDIERGDATPDQAAGWVARQLARGIKRPCLYASASVMPAILVAMSHAGVPRSTLRLWSAHYTMESHICGPHSCGAMPQDADGTQWTDKALGRNLDQSLLHDDFFGGKAVPLLMEAIMNELPQLNLGMSDKDLPRWYVRRLQAILNYVYGYPCNVTGTYDAMTVSAVKLLQAHYKLAVDGICGKDTWTKVIGG